MAVYHHRGSQFINTELAEHGRIKRGVAFLLCLETVLNSWKNSQLGEIQSLLLVNTGNQRCNVPVLCDLH